MSQTEGVFEKIEDTNMQDTNMQDDDLSIPLSQNRTSYQHLGPLKIDETMWTNPSNIQITNENKTEIVYSVIHIENEPALDHGTSQTELIKAQQITNDLKPDIKSIMRNTADFLRLDRDTLARQFLRKPRDIQELFRERYIQYVNDMVTISVEIEWTLRNERHAELVKNLNLKLEQTSVDPVALFVALKRTIRDLSPIIPNHEMGKKLPTSIDDEQGDELTPKTLTQDDLLGYISGNEKTLLVHIVNGAHFAGRKGNFR